MGGAVSDGDPEAIGLKLMPEQYVKDYAADNLQQLGRYPARTNTNRSSAAIWRQPRLTVTRLGRCEKALTQGARTGCH